MTIKQATIRDFILITCYKSNCEIILFSAGKPHEHKVNNVDSLDVSSLYKVVAILSHLMIDHTNLDRYWAQKNLHCFLYQKISLFKTFSD